MDRIKIKYFEQYLMFEENVLRFTDQSLMSSLFLNLYGQNIYKEYNKHYELEFLKTTTIGLAIIYTREIFRHQILYKKKEIT